MASVNGYPAGISDHQWWGKTIGMSYSCLWLFMGIHDGWTFVADIGNKGWLYRGPPCMMGIKDDEVIVHSQFATDKKLYSSILGSSNENTGWFCKHACE